MGVAVDPGDRAPGDGFLVLWLGGPGRWEPAVQAELDAAGVRVEDSGLDVLVERAGLRAPDLVVLTGAAASAPKSVIGRLANSHPACTVPVVAIGSSESARPKARARFGLVAQLDREASPKEIAKHLVALLRGLSRRPAKWRIKAGRADVLAIAQRFGRNTRSGLLTAKGAGAIAFDRSVGVAPAPEMLVSAIAREDVQHLTFYERAPGQIRILEEAPKEDETAPPLDGARVLVIDGKLDRAQKMAVRFEAAGAQARAIGLDRAAIIGARSLDPTLIVVAAPALAMAACEPLWIEPRLSSASLLLLSENALSAPPQMFLSTVAELCALEAGVRKRLESGVAIAERLSSLGMARWLKVLGKCKHNVTFRVFAASGRGRVDIRDGRVRGAAFRPSDTRMAMVEGRAAVDTLLALPFGRVLAGSPEALKKLEGVKTSRKVSMIGRITGPNEPSSSPVPDRHGKGLVAQELVAPARVPTPVDGLAPIKKPAREPTTRPPPPIASHSEDDYGEQARLKEPEVVSFREDDFEAPTRNYTASAMEDLRAELRTAAKVSETPVRQAHPSPNPRVTPSPVPARTPAARTTPSPVPSRRPSSSPPSRPKYESGPPTSRPRKSSSSPPNVSPLPEPILKPHPIPAPEPEKPKSTGSPIWFVAGIALALGVGGYAAWQLSSAGPGDPDAPAETLTPGETVSHAPTEDPLGEEPTAEEPTAEEPVEDPAGEDPVEEPPADDPPEDPVVQVPPTDASVDRLIEQTIESARARDYAQSEVYARQALARSPEHAMAAYRLGVALYRQQQHEEALTWAQRSTEWDPSEPRAHSIQGDIYMRTGRFRSAATAYQAAVDLEQNYGPALRGLERLRQRGVID